jgi:hypothetical protein
VTVNISKIIREYLGYFFLITISVAFIWCYFYLFGGDNIFSADASHDAVFHVDLRKDKNYQLWVLDMNGPERVGISITNGYNIIYEDTFQLMHPEGDYLPYHPAFRVKETGMYDITVHPVDAGTIRIGVQQDTGVNLNRVIRDIQNITGWG